MADKTLLVRIKSIFSPAQSRANITSGEDLETSLGKISKWFSDTGSAAFKDVPSSGDAGNGEVVLGNDSRLSDDRTPTAHNQAANTITAMTGYSKPASTSAITTADTLNEAIGKLEKGLEDAGGGGDLAAHIATHVEDTNGVHGIRVGNGNLEVYSSVAEDWVLPSEYGAALGNVTNKSIKDTNRSALIKWKDPVNTSDAIWKGTKLVMKAGAEPDDVSDGQLIYDNRIRDNFQTNGLTVENLTVGITYYFKLFPYTRTGTVTNNSANTLSITPKSQFKYYFIITSNSDPDKIITYGTSGSDTYGLDPISKNNDGTYNLGAWENAFFMPKPCMLKSDGTVDYYLDPNDYTKKADGTPSDIADPSYDGNAMMEFPEVYYYFNSNTSSYPTSVPSGSIGMYIANYAVSSSYTKKNKWYMGIYNGTGNDKLRSLSGIATTAANGCGNKTSSTYHTMATANDQSGNVKYATDLYPDYTMIYAYLLLITKTANLTGFFGNGYDKNSKDNYVTGMLNNKGQFYSDTTGAIKIFGMENLWGHSGVFIRGVSVMNDIINSTYYNYYKYNMSDTCANSSTGNPQKLSTQIIYYTSYPSTSQATSGYFKYLAIGAWGILPWLYANNTNSFGGSTTSYFTKYAYVLYWFNKIPVMWKPLQYDFDTYDSSNTITNRLSCRST